MTTSSEKALAKKDRNSVAIIFRYADGTDILLMCLGTIGAIGDGLSTNCLLVYVSHLFNSLGYGKTQQNDEIFMEEIEKCSLYFVLLGLAVMAVAFMEGYCWSKTSERQVLKIRYKYLEAILRQEVGFFDSQEATTSEITNSISKDTCLIQEVLSEKVPIFLMHTTVFMSGIAFSAYFSWRLALVALPTLILLIIPGLIYGKYLLHLSEKSFKEYGKANAIVWQALSSIKTIYSFTGEKSVIERYRSILDRTIKLGMKQGIAKGLAVGSTGLSFAIWALLAWYGSHLIMHKGESGGRIYAAGVSFVLGGLSLGMALPEVKYLTEASVAASRIFARIDRVPEIDGEHTGGLVLEKIRGEVEFKNVNFTYPCRPDTVVLQELNLKIEAGKTLALVGASGSGKSTAIALIQRFYDSNVGAICIDGVDIKSLQLKWLRGQMGLVSQEHALFGTSIKKNIMFGKIDATMDEVVAAAMTANAHNFITQLPEGYETKIGERGALLSGGQKQRIAIARAIIKNPVILLLDEATSALDSESETLVQNALDQASIGRTTLVVAHKLSTVRNADLIAVVSSGCITELGSHNELIQKDGHYGRMAKLQRQFSSHVDQEQSAESLISSVGRSSAGRQSSITSSPSIFASPLLIQDSSQASPPSFSRLLSLNLPEWKQGITGSLSAIAFGSVQPVYALTIGGMISAFYSPTHEEMQSRIQKYCMIFSILCLVSFVLNLCQHYNFAYMGEHLTRRIRLQMLEKILTFEAAWFDEEHNSSGALCSRLSNEAAMVKSLVADRVSLLVQSTSAVTVAMVMGLVVAWKLALVMIAVQPLTILCFYTRKVLLSTITAKFVKAQYQSTQIAMEAVYNHRIVTSFGSINKVLEIFDEAQDEPRKEARKKSWLAGVGIGSAQGLTFICWALDFWYGGKLVNAGEISAADVFKTFFILVSTGKVVAEAGSMTSDLAKGSAAVASIFAILDRKSLIQGSYNAKNNSNLEKMTGRIEMKKVDFAYPTRPNSLVLREFNLEVKAGTSIGLVGKSGCGKSTVIALIQRFYDTDRGSLKIDGMDIRLLDIGWYRRQMALVSQEPVIYSGTIYENILFGKLHASESEVVEAARAANAHDFISSLNNGYDTECGERGVQLSGGQKQRIAIARAIIRNPTILLLDEATSALDVQSEQVVQEALDRLMVGRTTVVVAHRLNTIRNVDSIAFVYEGKVVEKGTYSRLKDKRGAFFNLVNIQST
ncbi:putative ABC transporter B family member 8 [Nicotiana tabacum]|uniref:ABC transporter B family member 8 n=1 Tax=Nicotiana tabacum TaxID=4097 RepID=A0A1S4DL54_TOBAC|nr:putative ABC transporter B family member 8 isoform X1 [Nicotiana tomentosiformis]XP_016513999.1 PREDICTED: putative ABC transporter B family member 8 [Nicotiana tabacum]XP_033515321.1 putative ABC transporter B family member 8 isoform X1 [Nicotiana tomentosiformis]